MKRYFTLIVTLLISISFCYSMQASTKESQKVTFRQIDKKKFDYGDFERTINFLFIDGFYDPVNNEIEIELCNIGTAYIYIVDMAGAIVNETIVETDTYTTVTLSSALCVGNFHVVVDSDYIYAEGFVNQ